MEFQALLPKYMTETFHAQELPRQAQVSRINWFENSRNNGSETQPEKQSGQTITRPDQAHFENGLLNSAYLKTAENTTKNSVPAVVKFSDAIKSKDENPKDGNSYQLPKLILDGSIITSAPRILSQAAKEAQKTPAKDLPPPAIAEALAKPQLSEKPQTADKNRPREVHESPDRTPKAIDTRDLKEYLHGDGSGDGNSLPPIAEDFQRLGLATLAAQEKADKLKPQIYVSQRTGDSRHPLGSKDNPFQTIQQAVDKAPPLSVINVGPGIYKEKVKVGRSDLTIQSDPQNPAVLEPGKGAGGRGDAAFSIGSDINNVAIKNFEIRNFTGTEAGIKVEGKNISNITLAGNNIHSASGAEGIRVYGRGTTEESRVRNINLVSNKVHDLNLGQLEAMPVNGNVSDFRVIGNAGYKLNNLFIDAIGGEGKSPNKELDQARRGTIEFNYADGISSRRNDTYSREPSAAGIYIDGARDINIRNNYIKNSDFGLEIASEHSKLNASGIRATGNIIENAELAWLTRGGEKRRPGGARDSTVTNNLIIGNGKVQTQENVDLKTFHVKDNDVFPTITQVTKMPAAIAQLIQARKNGR
ncbi:MAG: hypothetical protein JNN26_05010 [Candidatus Obscuribacter sp.]|nr:hypothetical protein [Candidatus Obscuribacter sp.]